MVDELPVCPHFRRQPHADCATCYCCEFYTECPRPHHTLFQAPDLAL